MRLPSSPSAARATPGGRPLPGRAPSLADAATPVNRAAAAPAAPPRAVPTVPVTAPGPGRRAAALTDIATVLVWCPGYAATALALGALGPAELAVLRVVIATVLLTGCAVLTRRFRPPQGWRRDLPAVALGGATGITGYLLLVCLGQTGVGAGTASLILNASPLFTGLIAVLVLRERLGRRAWAGLGLGFAGTAAVALGQRAGLSAGLNIAYLLLAALVIAAFAAAQGRLLRRWDPFTLTVAQMWAALAAALPLLLTTGPADWVERLTALTPGQGGAVLFLGAVALAAGQYLWTRSMAAGVDRAMALMYAVPLGAVLCGWLLLDELPSAVAVLGGAVALVGVGLSQSGPAHGAAGGAGLPGVPVTRAPEALPPAAAERFAAATAEAANEALEAAPVPADAASPTRYSSAR
ncbi:DMT family transporter [Allostreptomyces psammosilenae]|uniref:Drug/metabolite transporter (DMT)-like permease n=1 Tax=Allostreptomyces psammosilenae TaxID=1892865 RepID=A0A853A1U6_9ACTN|nr:DMT family transporter [Allostreptomyces psammosilenae]NYI08395.1 drug/metabolite transporter (DMT)-like permease [Allostreptomyces psammosilenae]